MDLSWLERSELLIGRASLEKLAHSKVLIVGLGGVGSFAAEFIARAGIGKLTIIDGDIVDVTNKNRQLPALTSTIGMKKADLMAARIKDINPGVYLTVIDTFQRPEHTEELVSSEKFDYVMDCIDSITPKVYLIKTCVEQGQRLISSMGAGGKMDASSVLVADIKDTYNDPFARLVRKRLHKHGIYTGFKSVFNTELVHRDSVKLTDGSNFKRSFYGTISYMPALFGLRMAAEVIEDLL
ncbi:MAG: tRNA threonylcarbamoyladenosine dehydratase [Flavobacteriales bacterium]|nr:MAG: tRNA threonylcarbamoyladenosine dehydratase [Flavobacteriales bacterium]